MHNQPGNKLDPGACDIHISQWSGLALVEAE